MNLNDQMNTIKFLHVPGSDKAEHRFRLILRGVLPATVYGGYSVGYRTANDKIELAFAFCMDGGPDKRDEFNKKEARDLIRFRFAEKDTLKLTSLELAPKCFNMTVQFAALSSSLIETLVSTFVRTNLERLRHHAKTGFDEFIPVVNVYGQRKPTKAEREATKAARAERRAARVAERGEADPRVANLDG
ncbi:hypothetical protein D3C87_1426010 [compost metagenome]